MKQELDVQQLKDKIKYYENIINNMSAPVIPSVVPGTILIPIAGYMFKERFDMIQTKTLQYSAIHRDTERAIFDFTGVAVEDVASFDYNDLATEIFQLNSSLKLMGIRPIYVGFNPRFVREIVHAGIHVEIETYVSFRAALKKLLQESNQSLHSLG
ncbi:MAG: STAS domain-containing protein [Paenisporosarcina sp.]|uniref:STAS domain-containing protein n=1 Tax=Paenisporosarcina sp. TaxID=1932001 RepID=UPI003C7958F9